MRIFAFEFIFFIVSVFSILVSVSATALFVITYRFERKLRSIWRSLGFMLLAVAFFVYILERKFMDIELISVMAILFMAVGLFSIYRGVRAEPILSQLANVKETRDRKMKEFNLAKEFKEPRNRNLLIIIVIAIILLAAISILLTVFNFGSYVASLLIVASLVFVILTITIQVRRYQAQKDLPGMRLQNLYPLVGYIFLAVSLLAWLFHRLPESNIVFLRNMTLNYSWTWHLAVYAIFGGFLFLGIWAWNFIKIRRLLKIFVVFISVIILVATLGSLIFNLFLFSIVERNNLDLMERGAETQELIMIDRSNVSMLIAGLIAKDSEIKGLIDGGDYNKLLDSTDDYLEKTNVDRIRIYNQFGEVVVSPTDVRDRGRVFNEDTLVAYVINEKSPVKSFNIDKGVLAGKMVVRALYPITDGVGIRGVVEVGYIFDNAFTDFSKAQTGLDSTIYSGKERTATTILTQDGVSRWLGSNESDSEVLSKVFEDGAEVQKDVDRLGITYYSAYKPVKDVNGEIIGMVSVGVPTNILFEDARQQLLSVFLIISIVALLSAGFGAYVLYSKQNNR